MLLSTTQTTTITVLSDDEVRMLGTRSHCCVPLLVSEQTKVGLPLVAMNLDISVMGLVASANVSQTFANTSAVPIEATYIFPLPDRMAVRSFRLEVNGRIIDGDIQERGKARANYDAAIASGKRAAIAEEERSNVFTVRVGNIMPGERPTVTLAMVGALQIDDGEVTLQFPLVVGQRYTSGYSLGGPQAGEGTAPDTDYVPDASRITPPVWLSGLPLPVRLSGKIRIATAKAFGALSQITSTLPLHTRNGDGLELDLHSGSRLNRDLIVRWRMANSSLATSLACTRDENSDGGTFALTLFPPSATAVAQKPRNVVFVIDRSGSMAGWQIVTARRAVARMVDTLNSRDNVAVLAFDNVIEQPSYDGGHGLIAATDRNRFTAVEFLAGLKDRGGTEMEPALVSALQLARQDCAGRDCTVIFVTDGEITGEDAVINAIAKLIGSTKVHTIGIGSSVNTGFLRRVAKLGNGVCEIVESTERLDQALTGLHRFLAQPTLSDLELVGAQGMEIDRQSLRFGKLPDVYPGMPVVVLGRFTQRASAGASISLRGKIGEQHVAITTSADESSLLQGSVLATLWAKQRIRDLEDNYAVAPTTETEVRIVELSVTHKVLSRFTAFVAIDHAEVANRSGNMQRVIQAVEPDADAGIQAIGGNFAGGPPAMPARAAAMMRPAPASAPPSASAPRLQAKADLAQPERKKASAPQPVIARAEALAEGEANQGTFTRSASATRRKLEDYLAMTTTKLLTVLRTELEHPQQSFADILMICSVLEAQHVKNTPNAALVSSIIRDVSAGDIARCLETIAKIEASLAPQPKKPFWKR